MQLKPLFITLLLLAISIQASTAIAADTAPDTNLIQPNPREHDMRVALWNQIKTAWQSNDFKTLEELGQGYVDHPSKSYSGKLMLDLYMSDLDNTITIEWPKEWSLAAQSQCGCNSTDPSHYAEGDRRWVVVDGKLKAWAKRYPKSIILPLARVQYSVSRAWFYRGSDFAGEVNDKAWPLFKRYIEEADKVIKASASMRNRNPAWYTEAVEISVIANWPQAQRDHLYADMVEHATLYTPAYVSAAQFLQPQWGGDYAAIEELIRKAMQRMPEQDAPEFYARVYWNFLGSVDKSIEAPKTIAADWNTIKQGLNVVMERYPERINFQGAAMMACKFRDRPYLDSLARRLGTYEAYQAFPNEYLDCSKPDFVPEMHIMTEPAH